MLLAVLEQFYTHVYHAAFPPDAHKLATLIIGCWWGAVALFGAVMGARWLLTSYAKPQSALRLMIVAAGCVLLAFVPPFLIGMAAAIFGRAHDADLKQELVDPLAILSFGLMLLLAAIWQGRVAGDGDVRAGLGDAPVANYVPVTALAVAGVVYAALVRTVFHNAPRGLTSVLLIVPDRPAHNLYVFFVGICLAPLSEELFLRGWMWTRLRRTWSVGSTAMLTGGIWLLAHLANGIGAPVVLLPLAVILSAARHVGQSVRASLAIHASYNLMILLLY
jgi:membrane protease YdiL (CAAX protease family)